MIHQCDETAFLAAVKGLPFFGGRMESICKAYSHLPSLSSLYLLDSGALATLGGGALLFCGEQEKEEAAFFLQMLGIAEVISNEGELALDGYQKTPLCVMTAQTDGEAGALVPLRPEQLLALWTEKTGEERDEALSDLSLRFAVGSLSVWGITEEDEVISAVCADVTGGECYMSFGRTRDDRKRRGYASLLFQRIQAHYADMPVYLVCEESLRAFYEKNGFMMAAQQWRYQKI